jgi:hypothetical protein
VHNEPIVEILQKELNLNFNDISKVPNYELTILKKKMNMDSLMKYIGRRRPALEPNSTIQCATRFMLTVLV